jgi:hypothetical protein
MNTSVPPTRLTALQVLAQLAPSLVAGAATVHAATADTMAPEDMAASWGRLLQLGPTALQSIQVKGVPGVALPLLAVDPSVRTADTDRIAFVELAQQWMAGLNLVDISNPEVRQALGLMHLYLRNIFRETEDLFLGGGSLPQLTMESLQRALWSDSHKANVIRLHINMTGIDGTVGDAFKRHALRWLQGRFGSENVFFTPQGTSFIIRVNDMEIVDSLYRFDDEVKSKIFNDPKVTNYIAGLKGSEHLKATRFQPHHVALMLPLSAADLMKDAKKAPKRGKVERLNAKAIGQKITERIQEFLVRLSAATLYLEKNPPKESHLYREEDLPKPGEPGYARLSEMVEGAAGYVGPGVYGLAVRGEEIRVEVENPRLHKVTGEIDRLPSRDGGGFLQHFETAVGALLTTGGQAEFEQFKGLVSLSPSDAPRLGGLGLLFRGTLTDLVSVAWAARFYTAFPRLFKPIQDRMNLATDSLETINFFVEQLAATGFKDFAFVEMDDASAHARAYAPEDHTDAFFQGGREMFFTVAEDDEINMTYQKGSRKGKARVIMTPLRGDFGVVAFDPDQGNVETYLSAVQATFKARSAAQPSHREHKIKVLARNGGQELVERFLRVPVWKPAAPSEGPYIASYNQPAGHEAVMGVPTLTIAHTRLLRPVTNAEDGAAVMALFNDAELYIETVLKGSRGTVAIIADEASIRQKDPTVEKIEKDIKPFSLVKEGLGPLPEVLVPESLRAPSTPSP